MCLLSSHLWLHPPGDKVLKRREQVIDKCDIRDMQDDFGWQATMRYIRNQLLGQYLH